MVVTLKDIAQATGKSITTVSRALNDYDDVSPTTKELVCRVAADLGYAPNIYAQRLQKQFTETIGLIIPTFGPRFSDPFFSELLAGIGNCAAQLGYDLLVSTRAPGEEELESYRAAIRGRRVDGFILVRTRRQDKRVTCLQEVNFPFVAFGRTDEKLDFPFVDEDGIYGMRLVTEHLASQGHQRIACIAPPNDLMFAHYRLGGFKDGLSEAGIPVNDALIRIGNLTQRSGYEQASALLDLPSPPSAIAACNDLMAFGAMSAAQARGLVVGKDVAITGFDNIPMAEYSHPSLTTIHQPLYKIGGMVCEMLIQLIRGESLENKHILLKPELIVRQSSGL
ncbi:MAG: LacI family DNA-binding transcriptional regulator [Chloroflexi bacterium]|nr:LacI family DNA-binding transcriptional regulator [Chloroflexota bacterium]